MSTITMSPAPATGARNRRRAGRRGSVGVARQVQQQRRGYAAAVLRALARAHRGRPTAQVQRALTDALKPLGVGLSTAALHDLATRITAGEPVVLP